MAVEAVDAPPVVTEVTVAVVAEATTAEEDNIIRML
jgi:hypothetical protein